MHQIWPWKTGRHSSHWNIPNTPPRKYYNTWPPLQEYQWVHVGVTLWNKSRAIRVPENKWQFEILLKKKRSSWWKTKHSKLKSAAWYTQTNSSLKKQLAPNKRSLKKLSTLLGQFFLEALTVIKFQPNSVPKKCNLVLYFAMSSL